MTITSYYFLVLDIETSTLTSDDGEPLAVWLSYGYCILYDRDGDTVERCYFRDWKTLADYFEAISQRFIGKRIICFVHNLSYEMDFIMKNISKPKQFLTNSTHGFISAILEDYPQIEFRCTVKLTMEKLEKIGEQVGLPKLESPYRIITPLDEPTHDEIVYCQRDCDIVAKYVVTVLLKEWGTFNKMPLTKTGRVRKTYNKFYFEYAKENDVIWDLYPPEDCYDAINDAFAGGVTISNPLFTGLILKDVHSYDIKSSYPFAQLSELFPYTIEREYNPTPEMLSEPFYIVKIRFNKIHTLYDWAWLSNSKFNDYSKENSIWFNGKLIYAQYATRTVTNVDLEMINKTYKYESYEILEFYHMPIYGELPEPYIKTIYYYSENKYNMKQKAKAVTESDPNYLEVQADYMRAKGDFNSIYGMSVQKILQEEYEIDELFQWKPIKKRYVQSEKHLRRNFLFGVYVTAYARRNLLNAIITNCPSTFVYADTDSIKYIGGFDFQNTNKKLPERHLGCRYVAELGQFDDEGLYSQFVTFGAKKYGYSHDETGRFYLTIAGLPKDTIDSNCRVIYRGNDVESFSMDIHNFRRKTLFESCKLGKKYITENYTFDLDEDYNPTNMKSIDNEAIRYMKAHKIYDKGGVALYPTSYLLDMTDGDAMYCKGLQEILPAWLEQMKYDGVDLSHYINIEESVL